MGSDKAGGSSKMYDYYGSWAVVWHVGLQKSLKGIVIDDRLVWSGNLTSATSSNPVEISIPGLGIYRHYWGKPGQAVDPILQASGNEFGDDHPAYPNCCYGVFVDFYLGQEVTTARVTRLIPTREPQQSLITGAAAQLQDDNVNPFVMLAELFTAPFALGFDVSLFAAAKWQAAADLAYANHAKTYASAYIDAGESVRGIAADLFMHCDGWLRSQTGTGLVEAGMFTAPETVDLNSLRTVAFDSVTSAAPQVEPEDWDDVKNSWKFTFRDRNFLYKDNSYQWSDMCVVDIVGEERQDELSRRFMVRMGQVQQHTLEWARRFAIPGGKASFTMAKNDVDFNVGERIRLDIDPEPGGTQLLQVVRVLKIVIPRKGVASIEVEYERTLAPVLFTPAAVVAPTAPDNTPPDISDARLFEVPSGLSSAKYAVGVLASRPSSRVTDMAVYFSENINGVYNQIGETRSYALRGQINTDAAVGAGSVSVRLLDTLNRNIVGNNPGATAANNDTVLMIVFKRSGAQIANDGNGNGYMEVMSCSSFTSTATDVISVSCLRGRRGSTAHSFSAGDEVWFINREALLVVSHSHFENLFTSSLPAYFILQPSTLHDVRPLNSCTKRAMSYPTKRSFSGTYDAPDGTPSLYQAAIASGATRFNPDNPDCYFTTVSTGIATTSAAISSAAAPVLAVSFDGYMNHTGLRKDVFGTQLPTFIINFAGVVDHYVTLWYRIKSGGVWGAWTYVAGSESIEPNDGYGWANASGLLSLTGLTGFETIEIGVRGTDPSGAFFNSGSPNITGTVSVLCLND